MLPDRVGQAAADRGLLAIAQDVWMRADGSLCDPGQAEDQARDVSILRQRLSTWRPSITGRQGRDALVRLLVLHALACAEGVDDTEAPPPDARHVQICTALRLDPATSWAQVLLHARAARSCESAIFEIAGLLKHGMSRPKWLGLLVKRVRGLASMRQRLDDFAAKLKAEANAANVQYQEARRVLAAGHMVEWSARREALEFSLKLIDLAAGDAAGEVSDA